MSDTGNVFLASDQGELTDQGAQHINARKMHFGGGDGGGGMDTTNREYIDAKIDAVRAQNDARFSEVMHGVSGLGDRLDMQKELLLLTKAASERAEAAADKAQKSTSNIKWNVAITAIAVIGVLFVTWQLWMQGVGMTASILERSVSGQLGD